MPILINQGYKSTNNGETWEYGTFPLFGLQDGDLYTGGENNDKIYKITKLDKQLFSEEYMNYLSLPNK